MLCTPGFQTPDRQEHGKHRRWLHTKQTIRVKTWAVMAVFKKLQAKGTLPKQIVTKILQLSQSKVIFQESEDESDVIEVLESELESTIALSTGTRNRQEQRLAALTQKVERLEEAEAEVQAETPSGAEWARAVAQAEDQKEEAKCSREALCRSRRNGGQIGTSSQEAEAPRLGRHAHAGHRFNKQVPQQI